MADLFRSDRLLVRHVPAADATRLVVTFDNLQPECALDRAGFGEAFLAAQGIAAIHVLGAGNDWYQYPEMAAGVAAIRAAAAGSARVMTYGSSMGGHAAIRWAEAIGAHAILALSPQYAIDLETAPFERRWTEHASRIEWLPGARAPITGRVAPVIVFDPVGADGAHVRLIARDVPVRAVPLPRVGHPATSFLANVGLLAPLVLAVLDDTLDEAAFVREALARRRASPAYLAELARRQIAHRPRLAAIVAERALAQEAEHDVALTVLGRAQSAMGQHEAARATLARAIARTSGHLDTMIALIEALDAAGATELALAETDQLIAETPDRAYLHGFKAHLHWRLWQEQAAFAAIARARALDPNSAHLAQSLAYYEAERAARDRRWRIVGGGFVRRRLQVRYWLWRRRQRGEPPRPRPPGL